MSKAQGDGFRTRTNVDLNEYRRRLDDKLRPLIDKTERWYDRGDGFWVLAESWNVIENPNGDWKWHGWRVVGKEYKLQVYDEANLDLTGTVPCVNGCSVVCRIFTDKKQANDFFAVLMAP